MAARIGDWFYVGPDNGTVTLLLERADKEGWPCAFVQLDRTEYWLSDVSYVFHGRDIFSPVAAHLANLVPLLNLGTPFNDPVRLQLPQPQRSANGWLGEVIHIDHFGNIASNIRVENLGDALQNKDIIAVKLNGVEIKGMVNTFGEREEGSVVALLGSTGNLIVSVVNGNAAVKLNVKIGDRIEALFP
jgi:S-adenosylmethionine hydrolase